MSIFIERVLYTEEQKIVLSMTPEEDSLMMRCSESADETSFITYLSFEEARELAKQIVEYTNEVESKLKR